jgi:hypothetical protein
MSRTKTFLGVVAVMAAMLVAFAAPAMANDHNDWDWNDRHDDDRWWGDWNDRHNNDRWWDNRFDRFDFDDGFFFGDNEQSAESGDVDQDFDVSGTGDNSNQTAGLQGVSNTGNTQNQIGITQFGSNADDFELDDVGSSIEVSPTNRTSSDQEVNQAASAFGR